MEWTGDSTITIYAPSIVGQYRIDVWTPCWSWSLPGKVNRGPMCSSVEAAKAEAQKDYETRILSALINIPTLI